MRLRTLAFVAVALALSIFAHETFARGGGGGGRGGFSGGRGGNFGGGNVGGGQRNFGGSPGANRGGQAGPQRNTSNFFGANGAAQHNNWDHNAAGWQNAGNYGGYGYGGYGGWGGYGGFGLGVGLGYGLGGGYYGGGYYGSGYGNAYANGYGNGTYNTAAAGGANTYGSVAAGATQPTDNSAPASIDYTAQGENNFHTGRYTQAASDFRHALVDEPNNGGLLMMLGQTLFQLGDFHNAAGATEAAMAQLPEDKWGAGIENYTKLYGNVQDYTNQLKVLETARDKQPDDPALRFLLGFNFGYLGYPKHAVSELDKAVQLEGRDPAARKLHDLFAAKTGAPLVGPLNKQPATPAAQPGRTSAAEVSIPSGAVED